MSLRVDQLARDLSNNVRSVEPALREAYLTALKGVLASVGDRISPSVLSSAGGTLQDMMGSAGALHPYCFGHVLSRRGTVRAACARQP